MAATPEDCLLRGVQLVQEYRKAHKEAQDALEALAAAVPRVAAGARAPGARAPGAQARKETEGAALSAPLDPLGRAGTRALDELERVVAGGAARVDVQAEQVLDALAKLLGFRAKGSALVAELRALVADDAAAPGPDGGGVRRARKN